MAETPRHDSGREHHEGGGGTDQPSQRALGLLDGLDHGFCTLQVILDDAGGPLDYRILDYNRAFEAQAGLREARGRTIRELLPEIEPFWIEQYASVAVTGEPLRFEAPVERLGRWYEASAFRIGAPADRIVALLFRDITDRRQREAALRASEERQTTLLALSDALRPLADPAAIQETAMRLLAEHLGAERAGYAEVVDGGETFLVTRSYARGVRAIDGRHRAADYGPLLTTLQAGRLFASDDVAGDATLSAEQRAAYLDLEIRATANVPLIKGGQLVAVSFANFRDPHAWTKGELAFLEAVAERTWGAVERARAERAQREAIARYESQVRLFEGVTATTPDFVYLFDPEGRFRYANRRLLEVWGVTLEHALGKTCLELGYERWHHDMHMREIAQVIATKAPIKGEVPFTAPLTGIHGVYEYIFTPVLGADGEVEAIAGTTRDITERTRADEALRAGRAELQHAVHHDALTHLPNRRLLLDRLQLAVAAAARHHRSLAVLFIDLDGFKVVNDGLGHAAGDAALVEVARRLRASLREEDSLARLHGDEFAVVLPEITDTLDVAALARTLLTAIARPLPLSGRTVTMSASIGISVYPRDASDPEALLRSADLAMYRAKQDGKDDVRFFSPEMQAPAIERLALADHFEGALDRGEIAVSYQPVWESGSGVIVSFEALLRWNSPVMGAVSPTLFMPVAEERRGFGRLFTWSLQQCGAFRTRFVQRHRSEPAFAINVGHGALLRPGFPALLETALARADLQPRHVEVELTSRASIEPASVRHAIERLRASGVTVALDHFGGEGADVTPFFELPIDSVKLDPALVRAAAVDERKRRGAGAAVAFAHALGVAVVAVGIETDVERDVMVELGCDRLQGNLLAAPASHDEVDALVAGGMPLA
jgi:diguanylate cyclase (GGDEF)-like protein/PAS domain S-box-containing protein